MILWLKFVHNWSFSVVPFKAQDRILFLVSLFIHRKTFFYEQENNQHRPTIPNPASEHKFSAELCTKSKYESKTRKKTQSRHNFWDCVFARRAAGVSRVHFAFVLRSLAMNAGWPAGSLRFQIIFRLLRFLFSMLPTTKKWNLWIRNAMGG